MDERRKDGKNDTMEKRKKEGGRRKKNKKILEE